MKILCAYYEEREKGGGGGERRTSLLLHKVPSKSIWGEEAEDTALPVGFARLPSRLGAVFTDVSHSFLGLR